MKWAFAISASALLLGSGPVSAAKVWDCEYSLFREPGKKQSFYWVQGDQLVEATGDVLWEYKLLENSASAVMAARSGPYGSGPESVRFEVQINKATGKFLLTMSSAGPINGKQSGKCRLINMRRGN